ncbi:uncharacterized protein HMPREF1541_04300 [Cyphellophora europaea CBS 101466]|uniref:Rap-GAP domain-containing protein n=1 Tax=Cyphellophora europaea (strain CBS 101466) TaxID=1220924 RepID=W2RUP2_CYPE1|nr:uncharacterized protein HMPREF1541_04300 [Cyphellophora europaea CBS 101466]ETN40025.1 hypothetical protein HMPREF1541_04300 [Cyphellophora europaea CBS 101466]
MDLLNLDSSSFERDPDYARQWLANQDASPERGTIPGPLLDATSQSPDVLIAFSDTLGAAIQSWYTRVQTAAKARNEDRQDRSLLQVAQDASKDLTWLLQFTIDFLKHVEIEGDGEKIDAPGPCLHRLTRTSIDLALKSGKRGDIEYAIGTLHLLVQRFTFPEDCLRDTLQVLSASAMHLQPTPDRVYQCFRLLASGRLAEQVIEVMLSFVAKPSAANHSHELAYGRGALRLLQHIVDLKTDSGTFVVGTSQVIDALRLAASQMILRYVTDIIYTLHAILSHPSRRDDVAALDFTPVVELLRFSLDASLPKLSTNSIASTDLQHTTSPDKDANRSVDRHVEERDAAMRAVGHDMENAWSTIRDHQKIVISDYVLQNPRYLSADMVRCCIDFTFKGQLLSAEHDESKRRVQWLLQYIVRDRDLLPDCRTAAFEVLNKTMVDLMSAPSDATEKSQSASSTIADYKRVLLLQLSMENDKSVLVAISDSLPLLAKSPDCSSYIVTKLTDLVLHGLPTRGQRDRNALYATKALVSIFADSLALDPAVFLQAYDGLVKISSLECPFREARIASMRILFSIRSTLSGCIYITDDMSAGYIATALCRTRESAEAFDYGTPNSDRRSTSSSSLSSTVGPTYQCTWMFDDEDNVKSPRAGPSSIITSSKSVSKQSADKLHLDVTAWLLEIIRIVQKDTDWEVYSWVMVNLGSQLANMELFNSSLESIVMLRQVVCEQVANYKMHEPPAASGLKKSDVALCLFNILTPMIAYATKKGEVIQKEFGDELVKAFLAGIASQHYEGTARGCIHALSICSLEIPASVASLYPNILERVSRSMTQSHLTMHMLEFLSEVASLEELHSNFMQEEVAKMFGMCIQFLERTREQAALTTSSLPTRSATPSRQSGVSLKRPPYRAAMMKDVGVPQYASALAYHTMIRWFLSLRLEVRSRLVSWIVPRLIWKNNHGDDMIDEQSEVLIDMMQRTAFSDLGETAPNPDFAKVSDGKVSKTSWVVGYSIITAETAGHTGLTQITKRQASGTTHAIYQQSTIALPGHHAPSNTEIKPGEVNDDGPAIEMLPPHILLQMVNTAAPTRSEDQPTALPNDDVIERALSTFDRIPTVDSNKAGVIYIGPGQTEEGEFLMLQSGSADYDRFVKGLGYSVSLEPPLQYNPQGLRHPRDGSTTVAWRDRVTEIVFLIPTMMPPNTEDEPEWLHKKAHVGNCFVNIIFNNSGLPWDFERLRSQLNYINIVITPADTIDTEEVVPSFYHVQVVTKPGFPNISAAADPKVISAIQLPKFVRVLAINANVFAHCWQTKDVDKEFPSNWRERLQHIKRLKQRMDRRTASGSEATPGAGSSSGMMSPPSTGAGGRRTPVTSSSGNSELGGHRKTVGALAKQLDFGSWTSWN